jgi:hypothetical protein
VIHPDTELRLVDERVGYGVFATRLIPRGTVVWVRDALDQVLSPARVAALPPVLQQQVRRYAYLDATDDMLLCWDHGRYMNHACDASTVSVGTLLEIARRDLLPGEHITCEYGLAHTIEPFACTCGAPGCRGTLEPADPRATWERWDREAREAFAWALTVPQPALAAADTEGPGAFIVRALVARRPIALPSWHDGVPAAM